MWKDISSEYPKPDDVIVVLTKDKRSFQATCRMIDGKLSVVKDDEIFSIDDILIWGPTKSGVTVRKKCRMCGGGR